jgi:hypothetical protein
MSIRELLFSGLALSKSNSAYWSSTKRTLSLSSSSLQKGSLFLPWYSHIITYLSLNNNHPLTHPYIVQHFTNLLTVKKKKRIFFVVNIFSLCFVAGSAMTIIMLLTGLNSCANPFIFLAFSGKLCQTPRAATRSSTCPTSHTELNSESRLRSTNYSPDDKKTRFLTPPPSRDSYLWNCLSILSWSLQIIFRIYLSGIYSICYEQIGGVFRHIFHFICICICVICLVYNICIYVTWFAVNVIYITICILHIIRISTRFNCLLNVLVHKQKISIEIPYVVLIIVSRNKISFWNEVTLLVSCVSPLLPHIIHFGRPVIDFRVLLLLPISGIRNQQRHVLRFILTYCLNWPWIWPDCLSWL